MNIDFSSGSHPTGVILFIDDNIDEHEIFKRAMRQTDVRNEIVTLGNGEEALDFITHTKNEIFFIICDINMPKMDGLELKRRIQLSGDLSSRSIPFVYHSSQVSPAEVRTAFTLGIQGFIEKGDYQESVKLLKALFYFWSNCIHPKDFA